MNGRVYDPDLGRFLTPDANVQFLANLQSYNRYSYALNNPLRYTDPTGYFISGWFDTGVSLFISAVAIAACAGTSGAGCAIGFMLLTTAYNVTSMAVAGASFNQIMGSVFIGVAAGSVFGGAANGVFGQSLAGMMVGGAMSAAATNAFTTWAMGGSISMNSLLTSAATGAVSSAFSWYGRQVAAVSARTAEEQAWEQQGDREQDLSPGPKREDYTKRFTKGSFEKQGGPLNDPLVAAKIGEDYRAGFADPKHFERGGWIKENGWFTKLITGERYSIEEWTPISDDHITPTPRPSNAVASYHVHTYVELNSDVSGAIVNSPAGVKLSAPGPSCCGPKSDMGTVHRVSDYVISNVSTYRLDPNNTVYDMGRHWAIQGW